LDSLFGHVQVVTCVAVSPHGNFAVTGSRDATVAVWSYGGPHLRPADTPLAVLVGHEQAISCVAIDAGADIVASGSSELILIHKLGGDLVRVIRHPTARKLQLLKLTPNGSILAHYRDKANPTLAHFSANGTLLASVDTHEPLMDVEVSPRTDFVFSGGFGRQLVVRWLPTLEVVYTYSTLDSSIRAVTLAPARQLVLVGLASGHIGLVKSAVVL
jgi:WD40 repeat protein